MKRRDVLKVLAGAVTIAPGGAAAQTTEKIYRIGTLTVGPPIPATAGTGKILVDGLAKRGFDLGHNLAYEARGAAGKIGQMSNLMHELRTANVDVVVTVGYPSAAAAKASGVATVIASGSGDPVVTGLVESLAHPGGNVTGIADDAAALSTKRLGLLKAVSPQLRRVAMLWNRDDRGMTQRYDASAKAAQDLGVVVQPLGVREPNDFEEAFAAMDRDAPDAILMVTDSLTLLNRKRVFDYALEHRLPAIYEQDFMARDGGLMSYGADAAESFDRAAALAARIFQGAKPADLPVEIPTRYLFVVNMKTAKAMNFTMPNNVLSLADEVIE
ncbi:MAG TPA: ABC transporter substrate-binding protein [Xanthobacteraceae bacterium]|jgi:putative ABC transport system substrate-binding protein|nr:ABC transporter substrate-binding protein [Xanthobacteraceae bacterium]